MTIKLEGVERTVFQKQRSIFLLLVPKEITSPVSESLPICPKPKKKRVAKEKDGVVVCGVEEGGGWMSLLLTPKIDQTDAPSLVKSICW